MNNAEITKIKDDRTKAYNTYCQATKLRMDTFVACEPDTSSDTDANWDKYKAACIDSENAWIDYVNARNNWNKAWHKFIDVRNPKIGEDNE